MKVNWYCWSHEVARFRLTQRAPDGREAAIEMAVPHYLPRDYIAADMRAARRELREFIAAG